MTDADLIRAHLAIETEGSKPFYRDQHLTPQALFKAKVLAKLEQEANRWVDGAEVGIHVAIEIVEAIEP